MGRVDKKIMSYMQKVTDMYLNMMIFYVLNEGTKTYEFNRYLDIILNKNNKNTCVHPYNIYNTYCNRTYSITILANGTLTFNNTY